MIRRPLTDGEIANTLLRGESESACEHEGRLWDLARGALSPEETASVLDHALECADCRLALRVARETFAASGMPPATSRAVSLSSRWWGFVAGSVLSPAPALVYLLLLALSFPLYRFLSSPAEKTPGPAAAPIVAPRPAPEAPALRGVRVLRLTGDISLRGDEGAGSPTPMRVSLEEGETLMLKLYPDAADLPKDPEAVLLVRVLAGAVVVSETRRRVSDVEPDRSLSVVVDVDALEPGKPYRAEVATVSGPAILHQSFLWERR
ncbi:MAG TPA: zf-HC2 domain-containing protein [Candidatus Polarisedimenticolaceae bacterium]|nr:zf-HC2 domain-containing protein [Candidatus Polarisedimenticolaceae bacterium]